MPACFRYGGRPRRVRFLERPNRYLATVRPVGGGPALSVHVPNPGRMEELLVPEETEGWIVPCRDPRERKTRYDLVAVRAGRTVVSIDSRVANRLVAQALSGGDLRVFGRGPWRPEVRWGPSRWDFARLSDGEASAILEVKSSNLRVGRTALFPDAPTARGTRHLRALARARRRGLSAALLMMIQRSDVDDFAPNELLDPEFARAWAQARATGVHIEARTMRVRPGGVAWGFPVPLRPSPL